MDFEQLNVKSLAELVQKYDDKCDQLAARVGELEKALRYARDAGGAFENYSVQHVFVASWYEKCLRNIQSRASQALSGSESKETK
jgi:hypothetical protein